MPQFICNTKHWKAPRLVEVRRVVHPKIREVYDYMDLPGLGRAPVVRETNKQDRTRFQISTSHGYLNVDADRKSINKKIRKLRPEEGAALAKLDQMIYELQLQREILMKDAWAHGHIVTIKELEEMAGQS